MYNKSSQQQSTIHETITHLDLHRNLDHPFWMC